MFLIVGVHSALHAGLSQTYWSHLRQYPRGRVRSGFRTTTTLQCAHVTVALSNTCPALTTGAERPEARTNSALTPGLFRWSIVRRPSLLGFEGIALSTQRQAWACKMSGGRIVTPIEAMLAAVAQLIVSAPGAAEGTRSPISYAFRPAAPAL
jgi:hypothetical protein